MINAVINPELIPFSINKNVCTHVKTRLDKMNNRRMWMNKF